MSGCDIDGMVSIEVTELTLPAPGRPGCVLKEADDGLCVGVTGLWIACECGTPGLA